MKGRELHNLGLKKHQIALTQDLCNKAAQAGLDRKQIRDAVTAVMADPEGHLSHAYFAPLADTLNVEEFAERDALAPWAQWGVDLDEKSISQMRNACRLPIARRGALMPDAHVGYGLPIGGVLATHNAVIPYAVGVDIACRMRMTVLDIPASALDDPTERHQLKRALQQETSFGIGASFRDPRDHQVMYEDWSVSPVTQQHKNKAHSQLGSSGSGNHFAEYGTFTITESDLGLAPGTYLALLTHSGSRGVGASVADKYSKLAREMHPELPEELQHLSWLEMDSDVGQEYWAAMSLMGQYAAANHEVMHREIVRALRTTAMATVENHHNFAWKEEHDGEEMIVHRKGATPAGVGVLGIIPGSMASPAYVVRGRGEEKALRSAAHGAGRVMSRGQAHRTLNWADAKAQIQERGVELISAGLDEVPDVYKDINQVMGAQKDLVDIVGRFDPKMVKMAPSGPRKRRGRRK